MPRQRLFMEVQLEILRLKNLGNSQRKVAQILGINKDTVSKYWKGTPPINNETTPMWAQKINWEYVKNELKTVPIKIIYEEQKEFYNLPSYQAFCSYIKKNMKVKTPSITIKIERNPADSIEVDYSGDSVQILNPATGELYSVELFVGAMSYSGKIYAEFTLTQKLEDWILAHNNMFFYYGGLTSYIVPDNCKTAVTKTNYYDPKINKTYNDMCSYYGIAVDPADKESPTHKPNVEKAVSYIQTDFLSRIRNKTFTSLIELNNALKEWLITANAKVIQGRGESRDYFFEKEKNLLKPLPSEPYELFYFKQAKVHPDCHFQHQKNYYSVPHQNVGKEIVIKYNSKIIHAFYNCNKVATHKSIIGTYHYSTINEHYPENKFVEFNYHLAEIKKTASGIGENAELLIKKLIKDSKYPLKIIRKAQGILKLESKFGKETLDYACGEALEYNTINYDSVRRFAKFFKHRLKNEIKKPERQLELVCLQGGFDE